MPFLEFLFSPQAHKFRNGYYINHDTLLAVTPELRQKLIFYFIAEQIPQKLDGNDRITYENQRVMNIGIPRTIWMFSALVGPLAYYLTFKRNRVTGFRSTAILLGLGAVLTPLAGSVYTRVYEGRFVESSKVIEELSKKYKFGVYDFGLAKKQSHVLQVLHTMDAPYSELHVQQDLTSIIRNK